MTGTTPVPEPSLGVFGGGDVGRDLAEVRWADTPLGPVAQWPQSLVTVVRLLLSSRFPMWMAWGPELTLLCNDAYRPLLGDKYDTALGRPTHEVWSEIWPDIGPRIERVMRTGEATWDEALQLFVERSGYREEAYFTFSYSPLADDSGRAVGLFCVVSEETSRVVAARHLATARDLGTCLTGVRTRAGVLATGAEQLAQDPLSLPFTLSYLLDDDGQRAVLSACSGVDRGAAVAVPEVGLDDGPWPLREVLRGRTTTVDDLAQRFGDVPRGGWEEPATSALVVPFRQHDHEQPLGFLVAGVNRYRPLDEDHRGFAELVAGQLGAALASARVYEEERRTAEELADNERRIADELQRSLLPAVDVQPEALQVAAYYRAGAEGTQVGGDWYDVVELGAGRTALVLGDVMGRGVRAAAVMGQLRSAVRAYAGLDLRPADVLEHLDGVVRSLGDDQIVTVLYAVYDPYDGTLTHANAGHLPPLVRDPDGAVRQLVTADAPPLGTGLGALVEHTVTLEPGAVLALYTDGLVERRDADLDAGITALAVLLASADGDLADLPAALVAGLRPEGPDDDVAVLLARAEHVPSSEVLTLPVDDDLRAVAATRHQVAAALRAWEVREDLQEAVLLLLSELVTNGLVHGKPPVTARLRLTRRSLVVEVHDAAGSLPRRRSASTEDEHGRGLQLVSVLAERWGTRPTTDGKAVWFVLPLTSS
ncbi:MAG: histidine kinase [Frankiales bacterium]|nr:histidine kinase [Frankiales bacterium]